MPQRLYGSCLVSDSVSKEENKAVKVRIGRERERLNSNVLILVSSIVFGRYIFNIQEPANEDNKVEHPRVDKYILIYAVGDSPRSGDIT